ncbi:hypothetical protein DITRI_Ditri11bG0012700 [Diplodiscus trichospermus]
MLAIPRSLGDPELYEDCRDRSFNCGSISAGYPFSGDGIPDYCGYPGPYLYCDGNRKITTIEIDYVRYQVLELHQDDQTLTIARQDLNQNDLCRFMNSPLDNELFDFVYAPGYANVTLLYGCPKSIEPSIPYFNCTANRKDYKDVWVACGRNGSVGCSSNITVPILQSSLPGGILSDFLLEGWKKGFEVKLKQDIAQVCEK